MNVTASSPGKVIISGEHSAVYGFPAVVSSISLELSVTLSPGKLDPTTAYSEFVQHAFEIFDREFKQPVGDLDVAVSGSIPIGAGLGSSAALGHALFKALAQYYELELNQDKLLKLVQATEMFAHGRASGLDVAAVVVGGLLQFKRTETQIEWSRLKTPAFEGRKFWLINSGTPQESSKDMISLVRRNYEGSTGYRQIIEQIGELTALFISQLQKGLFEPKVLQKNHQLLEEIGVVSDKARKVISLIEDVGGVAKITGAGGVTDGSGMVLAYSQDSEKVKNLIENEKWQAYAIKLGSE